MAHEHPTLTDVRDRTPDAPPERTGMLFKEGQFIEGAELNELQGLARRQTRAIGDLVARSGNRASGAEISVALDIDPLDPDAPVTTASFVLESGRVYVEGNVLSVAARTFDNVVIAGDVIVGVRKVTSEIDHNDDPTLAGLHPGALSENEAGAYRVHETLQWALLNDGGDGDFIQVYQVRDGTVVSQNPPPALESDLATQALYDRARGPYIVAGCNVTALGDDGQGNQLLSLAAGEANIQGWKRIRTDAFQLVEPEDPDLELVSAETLTFDDSGTGTAILTVSRPPIANVISAVVTKRVSENVVRDVVPNGLDQLQNASIIRIESVTQGATTFDPSTYTKSGDDISWAPTGAEPAGGSSYVVTYLYFDQVAPNAFDNTTVTLSGIPDVVTDETVLLTYNSKIPRKDLVCLDINGLPQIVKGVSARKGALVPRAPEGLLKVAELSHMWDGPPAVTNNGPAVVTYEDLQAYLGLLLTAVDQLNRTQMELSVPDSAAISADGIFSDNFLTDFFRDEGALNTAAANQGVLQLPIHETLIQQVGGLEILDYTEEVLISQPLATGSMKVNPYANFNPMPGDLQINPNNDFWTELQTSWTSPVTREFTAAPGRSPGRQTITEEVSQTTRDARFLRRLDLDFVLTGFAPNEELESLVFAGRNVTPAGPLVADADGQIIGSFQIPANVPTGSHAVRADGAAGGFAEAGFVGEGEITVEVMRRVNLVTRSAPPPVINITQVTNVTRVTNVTNRWVGGGGGNGGGNGSGREGGMNSDPLAWTFVPPHDCYNLGFDIEIAAVGDQSNALRCQLARTFNGYPTNEVLADVIVPMAGVQVGDILKPRWRAPFFTTASERYCLVIMTDDPDHAVSIATLGEVVPDSQRLVSSQPYTNGDLFSGSNRSTWVAHPESDLKVDVIAARFNPTEKIVQLYEGPIVAITDLLVRGTVELQSVQTTFRFELERADGSVIPLAPGQTIEFDERVSETVKLRAVLNGTDYLSPILWNGATIIGGELQDQAQYVSKSFPMDAAIAIRALFDQFLPAGSSATIEVDAADDNWQPVPAEKTRALGQGWTEPQHRLDGFSAPNGGRIRLTLNGTPSARPSLARLRAYPF